MLLRVETLLRTARHTGYLLTALIILSVTVSAQNRLGKVMAKIDIESGAGDITSVTFKLFRVQAGCCDPCKIPPVKPCRKCGCLLASPQDKITLTKSGSYELFKDIPAGTYLVVDEV